MLVVSHLEVAYIKAVTVLRDITLDIPTGAIVALIGTNGAGKSTTLKSISGLLSTEYGKVTAGEITFNGERIDNKGIQDIVKLGIVHVMERRRILAQLTTEQNLVVASPYHGGQLKMDLDKVYSYFPFLRARRHQISGYMSGGEQQMLAIGRALMRHPKLMLLDEPSLGLAPIVTKEIFSIIEKINIEEKTSILLVEQNALAALTLAQYGYVMENGRIPLSGLSSELRSDVNIKEFYLGISADGERKTYKRMK
jgi:branched-chain amino acid transport system ATP-binding protein